MEVDWIVLNYWIGMVGIVAFAITAVLAVASKEIDLFGAVVFGIITAVGGGTLRDIILDVPVFWATEQGCVWAAFGASILAFYADSLFNKKYVNKVLLYLDALGIAVFGVQAANKVWDMDFCLPLAPVMFGVITAIGGGLIRDVLVGRQTLLTSRELYAIPVFLGCTLHVFILNFLLEFKVVSMVGCILLIFLIRVAAIQKKCSLPQWMIAKHRTDR
ncbi:MAG: hypothetical protein B6I31_01590 [Desulfobacteraceae bacterium 4572_19]|nr:MAG: hypothetical protein B6I31_01590 [Desulfobacteraceae bacterium 4572_19]